MGPGPGCSPPTAHVWDLGESDSKPPRRPPGSGPGSFTGLWGDEVGNVEGAEDQGKGAQRAGDGNERGGN